MTLRGRKTRTGICARCHREREMNARNLCGGCYAMERQAGRIEQWPLVGHAKPAPPPPPLAPDPRPDAPLSDRCDWCGTPLTRSRRAGGERLCEVYTVNGRLVAVCFEGCPTERVDEPAGVCDVAA